MGTFLWGLKSILGPEPQESCTYRTRWPCQGKATAGWGTPRLSSVRQVSTDGKCKYFSLGPLAFPQSRKPQSHKSPVSHPEATTQFLRPVVTGAGRVHPSLRPAGGLLASGVLTRMGFSFQSAKLVGPSCLCVLPIANSGLKPNPHPSDVIIHLRICLPPPQHGEQKHNSISICLCFPSPSTSLLEGMRYLLRVNYKCSLLSALVIFLCESVMSEWKGFRHDHAICQNFLYFSPRHTWYSILRPRSLSTSCPKHVLFCFLCGKH